MKIHIVIPVYNNYLLTNQLLWKLYQQEYDNIDSVTVMDDCSPDIEVQSGLDWWKEHGLLPLQTHKSAKNWGFLHTANAGIRIVSRTDGVAPNDVIVLISNDVLVHGKFLENLKDLDPKILVGGKLYTQDTGWNKFGNRVFPYLEGWLLATTVEGWKELDYFDERYAPYDFEDVDLSTQAIYMGYDLVAMNNPSLVHIGAQSMKYGEEREKQTKINQRKFEDKWIK